MTMNKIIVNLLLRKPYFGYVLSNLKIEKSQGVKEIKLLLGPVIRLIYNPLWLESLCEDFAFGVILHELLHLILLHPLRRDQRKVDLWAVACDLAVNEHIEAKMLPPDYLTIEKLNGELKCNLEKGKGAEYYYQSLLGLKPGEGMDLSWRKEEVLIHFPDSDDVVIKVEKEDDISDINSKAVQCTMEEITKQAADEGEINGQLRNAIQGVYKSVDVNWRNVLKKYLAGKGRMEVHKTVKRISKRFDDLPGNRRRKGLEALVAIDESGSIGDDDIMTFFHELGILKRITKADIKITRFDTDCTKPIPLEKYLKKRNRVKRGGTDFRPIFTLANQMNARLVLIFTDGDGLIPTGAKQKVLWVLTNGSKKSPPFGDTVQFTR